MASIASVQTGLQNYLNVDEGKEINRNGMIQYISQVLSENSCPMTLRKLIEVQHSDEGIRLKRPDGQSIHIKALAASTVGSVFTLATRIVRCAVTTIFLPLSVPYSAGKASRYNLEGEVIDNLKRTAEEWKDLIVAIDCVFIGLGKFVYPSLASGYITSLRDYYFKRIDERNKRDAYVAKRMGEYATRQEEILKAWKDGVPVPAVPNT